MLSWKKIIGLGALITIVILLLIYFPQLLFDTPDAPENLMATSGDSQIMLSWSPPLNNGSSSITEYRIYRRDTSYNQTRIGITTINKLTFIDQNVTIGTTYYYRISAVNRYGEGAQSNEANATAIATPSAPLNLQAAAANKQVKLIWSAPNFNGSSSITNYRIYRGITSGGEDFLIEIGNVLTYTDTGLTNGQTYYYKVSAKNAVGEGTLSNEANSTPATLPSAPLNLKATAGKERVTLTWEASTDDGGFSITNYTIYRGILSEGETYFKKIGNVLTYVDIGLTEGQTYYYKISANNIVGEGPKSNEASARPPTKPSTPQNLHATAGDSQVILTWDAPSDNGGSPITKYKIYRRTSIDDWDPLGTTTGDDYTFPNTGLINGQTYYYKVSAENEAGEGPVSTEVSTTPFGGINWLIIIGIISILVALIVGIISIYFMRKKGKTEFMDKQAISPNANASQKVIVSPQIQEKQVTPPPSVKKEEKKRENESEQKLVKELRKKPKVEVILRKDYVLEPDQPILEELNVNEGDKVTGYIKEKYERDFDCYIVKQRIMLTFRRGETPPSSWLGEGEIAYDVKWKVPKGGPWFLILSIYQKSLERHIKVVLRKEREKR